MDRSNECQKSISFGNFRLQDGKHVRFWEDKWLGMSSLKEQYPNLYNIVRRKNAMVADIMSFVPFNISFRRSLVGQNLVSWHNLVLPLVNVHLDDHPDTFIWSLHQNGRFFIASMYNAMSNSDFISYKRYL